MAAIVGRAAKVALGSTKILGIGTWTISGIDVDIHEDTEMGDTYKTYKVGLRESGTVAFNGYYDPANANGQTALRTYWQNGTTITSLRFYEDGTSYWIISNGGVVTAGGGIIITSWEIGQDKNGLGTASFSGKVSGVMYITQ